MNKIKKYVQNKIKQFLSYLLRKIRQFINSRFCLSLIMLAIGSSYTVIYFTAPEVFQPRVSVYANNSNVGSSEPTDSTGDEEVEEADDILTCNDWAKIFAQEYQVNENLLLKIITAESGNNEKARNPESTATGCAQWIFGSWESYGKKLWKDEFYSKNIYNPKDNVELMAWTISEFGTSPWDASRAVWGQ